MTPDDRWRFAPLYFHTRADLVAGRRDWYRIDNAVGDVTKVYIYDQIGFLGITAQDFVGELGRVRSPEIELHLNSPGGEVFDGVAIYNALLDHPAKVTGIVDGAAHSAASFILQAADRRVMNRNSELLIHDGQAAGAGDAAMFKELIGRLDEVSDNLANIYAQRSGRGDGKYWRKAMRATTRYGAQQAVDAGLADEVAGSEAVENHWDLSLYNATPAPAQATAPTVEPQGGTIPPTGPAEYLVRRLKGV